MSFIFFSEVYGSPRGRGYSNFCFLLHRLTIFFGGQNFEINYFLGFGTFPTIFEVMEIWAAIFGGMSFLTGIFQVGVSVFKIRHFVMYFNEFINKM